jgi:hypothetical protein
MIAVNTTEWEKLVIVKEEEEEKKGKELDGFIKGNDMDDFIILKTKECA